MVFPENGILHLGLVALFCSVMSCGNGSSPTTPGASGAAGSTSADSGGDAASDGTLSDSKEEGRDSSEEHDSGPDSSAPVDGGGDATDARIDGAADATADASDADGPVNYCESVSCAQCHGTVSTNNCAPPRDFQGHTEVTDPGVGVHQAHLSAGPDHPGVPSRVVLCTDCHTVPTLANLGAAPHMDGTPDVTFSGPVAGKAVPGGAAASYDPTTHKCSMVYCHRPRDKTGGINTSPTWTVAASANCGACHNLPPALPHMQSGECFKCHGDVIGEGGVWINAALHINGVVDVKHSCDSCHGGAPGNFVSSAPPFDLGNPPADSNTDPEVGAHQPHLAQLGAQMGLVSSIKHKVIECSECHKVPATVDAPGHMDSAPAELTFGPLATSGGLTPTLDKSDPSKPHCSNTFCHGGSLCDGYNKLPQWNGGAAESMCGSCHGIPPAETRGSDGVCGGVTGMKHSSALGLSDCPTCHIATMIKTGPTTWDWANEGACHVNGKVSTATCDN